MYLYITVCLNLFNSCALCVHKSFPLCEEA